MAGGGDPYLPHDPSHTWPWYDMTLPILSWDPAHTLCRRPVSADTLGGTLNIRGLTHWNHALSGNSKWMPLNIRFPPLMNRMPVQLHSSHIRFFVQTNQFICKESLILPEHWSWVGAIHLVSIKKDGPWHGKCMDMGQGYMTCYLSPTPHPPIISR